MKTFLIRGVPVAMQQDGWWLNTPPPIPDEKQPNRLSRPAFPRLLLLVGLIALGDILVWQVWAGLSLAVFGAALIGAALWVSGVGVSARRQAVVIGGSLAAVLPLVEVVQPLSILIAIIGLSAMLSVLAGVDPTGVLRAALRIWPAGVRQTFLDATSVLRHHDMSDVKGHVSRWLRGWLIPVTFGLIFVILLVDANPIASGWAESILRTDMRLPNDVRVAFWLCLLPLCWTVLSLHSMRERLRRDAGTARIEVPNLGLINAISVTRALVMFNAVFALQTGMDAVYLYGGFGLPEGISYAAYAHRGAYALVITALLAGGFALLSRRWVEGNAMLRGLLMLWVAQNVALVVSSLVRLDLYVEVYGLTHWRLSAAIWMALVAGGLGLIFVQVWRAHNTGWLMLRGSVMAGVVLYACAWVGFDGIIARSNLKDPALIDRHYLCALGDAARPVVAAHDLHHETQLCADRFYQPRAPRDWREWGFRNWRARTSLAAIQVEARP